MSCKTCEVLIGQVEYLQKLVDKLLIKNNVEPIKKELRDYTDFEESDNGMTTSEAINERHD